MEVENGKNTRSPLKYTGRSTGGDESKTTMAALRTDGAAKPVDKRQTHGTPKYRILPKLLSAKRSQKENSDLGKTGFHVRVSPVATSTPKDKLKGRVVTSQEKRAESRAKRRQYLAGECLSPSSGRTIAFPSSPPVEIVESGQKQAEKGQRPNNSPPVRPSGSTLSRPNMSPPARPNGSPVLQPNSSPPARPSGSPVLRPNSSPPARPSGSPVLRPNSSPPARPSVSLVSRPNSSPPARPSGSPASRPTGCPPPRPGSSSGVSATLSPPVSDTRNRTTNKSVIKYKTTNRTDAKNTTHKPDMKNTTHKPDMKNTTHKPDMKSTSPNNSESKDRTKNTCVVNDRMLNKSYIKDNKTNNPDAKNITKNKSAVKDTPTDTSKLRNKCDTTVIKDVTIHAALPNTKTIKPPKSTDHSISNRCESSQTTNKGANVTPSSFVEGSISPYDGYRETDTTKTDSDEKTETESTTTPGRRLLVGRVTPTTKTCVPGLNTSRSGDKHESHAGEKTNNETVSMATGDIGMSPHLLLDVVNKTAMARTVSHNDALSKSATSGTEPDWTGSAPEQLDAGKTRLNYTSPDEHRTDKHNDNPSDRHWTSARVVRSRSDVFSCGQNARPIVSDCVKLTREGRSSRFGDRCRPQLPPPAPPARTSLSADDIDTSQLILLSTRRSFTFSDRHSNLRSSFMQPPPKSAPSEPIMCEPEDSDIKPDVTKSGDTGIYSLPQPQCYSEDTMKAIKQITDKYDTLQRRRLQAMSFRETSRRKPSDRSLASTTSGAESDPAIADSAAVCGDRSASTDNVDGTTEDAFDADEDVSLSAGITQRDIARLELFYGSRDTEIVICRCLADILFSEKSTGNHKCSPAGWRHAHTGVPVFVLNTGRGTRKRDLRIVLAERETGFGLWHDKITYLSNYTSHEGATAFHTMQHSSRPIGDLVGLRFYDAAAAETFHARFVQMTADQTDELWRVGTSGHRKSSTKKRWRLGGKSDASSSKSATKRDISQPCNFAHVTNVRQLEPGLMSSLADMIARTVARREVGRSPSSRPSSYSSIASST